MYTHSPTSIHIHICRDSEREKGLPSLLHPSVAPPLPQSNRTTVTQTSSCMHSPLSRPPPVKPHDGHTDVVVHAAPLPAPRQALERAGRHPVQGGHPDKGLLHQRLAGRLRAGGGGGGGGGRGGGGGAVVGGAWASVNVGPSRADPYIFIYSCKHIHACTHPAGGGTGWQWWNFSTACTASSLLTRSHRPSVASTRKRSRLRGWEDK